MADYPPPQEINPIWNTSNFLYGSSNLTIDTANGLYIKKTGSDTAIGPLTVSNQILASYFASNTDGTVLVPAFGRSGGGGLGMYFSTNQINWAVNGVQRMNLSTTKLTSTVPIVMPSGSASNCSIQSATAANTGINSTTTQLNLVAAGLTGINLTSAIASMGVPIRAVSGSAGTCGYHFLSESGMGLFYVGTNTMGVATGAMKIFEVGNSGITFTNSTYFGIINPNPTPLGYYETRSVNLTLTNGNNSQIIPVIFTRIGSLCNATIPYFSTQNTNGANTQPSLALAASILPRFQCVTTSGNGLYVQGGIATLNGTRGYAVINITTTDIFFFYNTQTNIASGTTFVFFGSTISYVSE